MRSHNRFDPICANDDVSFQDFARSQSERRHGFVDKCYSRFNANLATILERRLVVAELCPGLRRQDFAGSLYALWTGKFQLEIAGAEQSIPGK